MYKREGQSGAKVSTALQEIDEKLQGIRDAEKKINHIYEMIKELHHVISTSTELIDSIAIKVHDIKDHAEKARENTQEAKELYVGAKEVGSIETVLRIFRDVDCFGDRHQPLSRLSDRIK
jgi:t-SNARE complex subunit (syntaxin)